MVTWEALDALSHQLELCKIDASPRVVVLASSSGDNDRVALVRAAVTRTGAEAVAIEAIQGGPDGEHAMLAAALNTSDIVISHDLPTSPNQALGDLLAAPDAPQHLRLVDDVRPQDYPPHENLRRRVLRLVSRLTDASQMRIFDEHGSDLTVRADEGAIRFDHGLLGDDLDHASYPAGWAAITPAAATVHGELVLMPGDIAVDARRFISSPIRLQIQDDLISSITGENPDADVLRALFEYGNDPHAYGMAEVSVGLNPGARVLTPFDSQLLHADVCRLHAGMVTVSFGDNLTADRPCRQTITVACPGRSLEVDGLPVITNGVLVDDFAPDVYEQ